MKETVKHSLFIYFPCIIQAALYPLFIKMIQGLDSHSISSSISTTITIMLLLFHIILSIYIIVKNTAKIYYSDLFANRNIILLILLLYVEFAIFEPPGIYMLVNSAQHSFIVAFHPEMPSYIASLWITFECAIIIMISWLIFRAKDKNRCEE